MVLRIHFKEMPTLQESEPTAKQPGLVLVKDIQPPFPLEIVLQCSETNENTILRFL